MLSSQELAAIVSSEENKDRVFRERKRYDIYHGRLRDFIREAIFSEFKLKETVAQLVHRIVPLNITQKIINKLSKVYLTQPQRSPVVPVSSDEEAINLLTDALGLTTNMLDANRYFKLSKHFCLEPFVNLGKPQLRVLAAHHYTPVSDDIRDPTRATYIIKHLKWGRNDKDSLHIVWSDLEHYLMDGKGNKIPMVDNPDGVNPYGINPLVYTKSQKDALIPIEDDDLMFMQLAICLLLTDLNFASKFKLWNIVYIIGLKSQNVSFNPNSILFLPKDSEGENPVVGTIESRVDSDALLRQIQGLVGMLLSTKSLKAADMQNLTVETAASGVAKMLDSADSTEDKIEQQNYFVETEKKLFEVLKKQLPIWSQSGELDGKYRSLRLTEEFELQLRFPMPKAIQSEKETVETEKAKLESDFTTHDRSLAVVNPDLTPTELEELKLQIEKEKKVRQQESDKNNIGDDGVNNNNGGAAKNTA